MSGFEDKFSKDDLDKLFLVDTVSGKLFWKERPLDSFKTVGAGKIWNKRYASKQAGHTKKDGYCVVGIHGVLNLVHRVIWLLHSGSWPKNQIDHIDGDCSNNSLTNLREVCNQENSKNQKLRKNNRFGVTGVNFRKDINKYRAYVQTPKGELENLGLFSSIDLAIKARKNKETEYNYHPNHGRSST